MDLMIVQDVMLGKKSSMILTGPLLLSDFTLRSEIEDAFGQQVFVQSSLEKISLDVLGVSVSQGMAGNWQVSLAVECTNRENQIPLDSIVRTE